MPDVLQDRANTTLPGTSSHFDNNDSKDTLMETSQNILHDNLLELNPSIQVIVNENKLIPHLPTVKKDLASHQRSQSTSRRNNMGIKIVSGFGNYLEKFRSSRERGIEQSKFSQTFKEDL